MALTITFYQNKSDNNTLAKNLTRMTDQVGTLKKETSVMNPTLIINSASLPNIYNCNYIHILEFSRYYFVKNITSVRDGIWELDCHVDVLMSNQTAIKALSGVVARNEAYFNAYLPDKIPVKERPIVQIHAFPNSFNRANAKIVLAVAGKGV